MIKFGFASVAGVRSAFVMFVRFPALVTTSIENVTVPLKPDSTTRVKAISL